MKKTNFMVFGNKHINEALKIRINNEDIVKVSETKFLGIYIDFRLKWKKNIQNISNKVSKCIAIIYRASRVLNETALIMLYNTLVLHCSTYCSEVWGRAYRNNLYPLNIKQKQIVRIIAKIGRYDHTSPFFSIFKILKLFDLFDMKILCFMF